MSQEFLQVTAAHLRKLAARHGQAAAEIASATKATSGVNRALRTSHGAIASSTACALEAMQEARRDAGYNVACKSEALSRGLRSAADRYGATDTASGAVLDQHLKPWPGTPAP